MTFSGHYTHTHTHTYTYTTCYMTSRGPFKERTITCHTCYSKLTYTSFDGADRGLLYCLYITTVQR